MPTYETYQTKAGPRYSAAIYVTGPDGPIRKKKRGFKLKKDAKDWAARETLKLSRQTQRKISRIPTFSDVTAEWLIEYKKTVKESTLRKTLGYLDRYILPAFGDLPLDKLTHHECSATLGQWQEKHSKYGEIARLAKRIYKYAMQRDYVDSNPWELVSIPSKQVINRQVEKSDYWTADELKAFLAEAEVYAAHADPWQLNPTGWVTSQAYAFFRLLAYTGIRKGEALALHKDSYDPKEKTISITRTVSYDVNYKTIIQTPKTRSSIRTIPIDDVTASLLDATISADPLPDSPYLFHGATADPIHQNRPRYWLRRICKSADIRPIKVHGLRHTHATLMLESGASVKEVQERLGHSTYSITMDTYAHVTDAAQKTAINRFTEHLK
ncbi:tyrosine-type recombinase/integrase [Peptococcus simiae]|uniref:tyrosine-type recombinase/integrase n=1 Tax=Peptococcus simiae TaxID=1643805 RepID=UPI00397FA9A6